MLLTFWCLSFSTLHIWACQSVSYIYIHRAGYNWVCTVQWTWTTRVWTAQVTYTWVFNSSTTVGWIRGWGTLDTRRCIPISAVLKMGTPTTRVVQGSVIYGCTYYVVNIFFPVLWEQHDISLFSYPIFYSTQGSQTQISHTEDLLKPRRLDVLGLNPESLFLTNSQVSRMQPNQPEFLSWDTGCFWIWVKIALYWKWSEKSRHTVNFLKDKISRSEIAESEGITGWKLLLHITRTLFQSIFLPEYAGPGPCVCLILFFFF